MRADSADITVNGRTIKAVAQPTKQAFLYVFDRETGEPIWPIEERPVPKGDVPGEWYSPTQPFPTKPPAYDRQGVSIDDLIDFTPELRAEAVKVVERYKIGPIFTPPVVSKVEGPLATLTIGRSAARTGRAARTIPRRTSCTSIRRAARARSGSCRRRPDLSDMNFIQGNALTGARRTGGSGSAARRRRAPASTGARPRLRRRRGRRRPHGPGLAAGQAAVRADQRHRS